MPKATTFTKPVKGLPAKPPRKSSKVNMSAAQLAIADAVLNGATQGEAAAIAGCHLSTAGYNVKHSDVVRGYLDDKRGELSDALQLKRGDIITGLMDSIEMAKLCADPGSMIRGWSEIGKMLGLYAPEVRKVEITSNQRAIASKFEAMSDEDLLAIAEGKNVIDVEFRHVGKTTQ